MTITKRLKTEVMMCSKAISLTWPGFLGLCSSGVGLGSLTGLIPGFHVNNVALILLALSPALLDLGIPLSAVAAIIVATGTVHTFLNYIPSALIGAPDGGHGTFTLARPSHAPIGQCCSRRCLVRKRLTTRSFPLASSHHSSSHCIRS